MRLKTDNIFFVLFSTLLIILCDILGKRMFDDKINDGFYSQVFYVYDSLINGVTLPLFYVIHFFRFFVISPFFFSDLFELPAGFDAFFYVLFVVPVFFILNKRFNTIAPYTLLLLPLLFSFRASLAMIGMFYLYICLFLKKRSYFLLLASVFLCNLSSGTVFAFLFAIFCSLQYLFKVYKLFIPFFFFACIGFVISFINKYEFMLSRMGESSNGSFIERSTIYVSYVDADYIRLILYLVICVFVLFFLFATSFEENFSKRKCCFFLGAVPLMFFEGIGLISYFACLFFIYEQSMLHSYRKYNNY